MTWTDLDSINTPTSGKRAPAAWGAAVNANMDHLNDNVLAKLGQWTSFTPYLTQSNTPTKTYTYARYMKLGRLVIAQVYIVLTSSGTAGNNINVGIQGTAAQSGVPVGQFYVYDASAGLNYTGVAALATTTSVYGLVSGSAGVLGAAGFTAALAAGDAVLYNIQYEAAS